MRKYIVLALRIGLAAVFLYAAWTKLRQPWLVFALSIDAYQVLPEWAVLVTARVVPWLEVALGVLLLAGWQLRWVSTACAALLGGFLVLMFSAYLKGMGIDCGCFGLGEAIGPRTLARDSSLLAAAVALTVMAWRRT
jgi:uncharacterized membrane protein YphA (DoxX/SURF4 family)